MAIPKGVNTRALPPIRCIVCHWQPSSDYMGGIRWKMLAKHYEDHILDLETAAVAFTKSIPLPSAMNENHEHAPH